MEFQTICWIKLRFRISNCLFDHFYPTWINFLDTNFLNLISPICIFCNWCFWCLCGDCLSTPLGRKLGRNPETAPSKSWYFFENLRRAHTKFWQSEMESRSGFALRCYGEESLVFSDNVATQLSAGPVILIPSIAGVKFIPIVSISPDPTVCAAHQLFQVLPEARCENNFNSAAIWLCNWMHTFGKLMQAGIKASEMREMDICPSFIRQYCNDHHQSNRRAFYSRAR